MNEDLSPTSFEELDNRPPRRSTHRAAVILIAILLVGLGIFLPMIINGFSFQRQMSPYHTLSFIVLADLTDPSKQCRCMRLPPAEVEKAAFLFGMSLASGGTKQECGHDALAVFIAEEGTYTLAISRRCGYIKYPPTPEYPFGEPRRYAAWLIGDYVEQALAHGEACNCID